MTVHGLSYFLCRRQRMIAVIDYGAGNIRSVQNAIRLLGEYPVLSGDPDVIRAADRVILPGVGAFGDAMNRIRNAGLDEVIRDVCSGGTPFLGICLGLQLLFDESEESPGVTGLGILHGKVKKFPSDMPDSSRKGATGAVLKVPEIGWNDLIYPGTAAHHGRLFHDVPEHSYVYFVHSYYLDADDPAIVTARSEYGIPFDASVEEGNVFACQFHPEKSERIGLQILENFLSV